MNDETKFLMVTRLIACLCRLDENKYKELMIKLGRFKRNTIGGR